MDKETEERAKKNGMIEIKPGLWVTSARTPAEDSADWSVYSVDKASEFEIRFDEYQKQRVDKKPRQKI